MAERRECGWSYGWFTTVAMQRLHGISPSEQKRQRAHLRIVGKAHTAAAAAPGETQQDELARDPDFTARVTDYLNQKVKQL
jgi:hypothetical protein